MLLLINMGISNEEIKETIILFFEWYKNIPDNIKKIYLDSKIDEPLFSSTFTNCMSSINNKIKSFNEIVFKNFFKTIWTKKLGESKKWKALNLNENYELDAFLITEDSDLIIEFKYFNESINNSFYTDIIRTYGMMLKTNSIKTSYFILTENPIYLLDEYENIDDITSEIEINFNDEIFNELNSFLTNKNNEFNIDNFKETIKNLINENKNKIIIIKINKCEDDGLTNIISNNLENKLSFFNLCSKFFDKLDLKIFYKINIMYDEYIKKINSNSWEMMFIENDFENIKNIQNKERKWNSLFRTHVMENIFYKRKKNEREIDINYIDALISIESNNKIKFINLVRDSFNSPNNEINDIGEKIINIFNNNNADYNIISNLIIDFDSHMNNLLYNNKEIKEKKIDEIEKDGSANLIIRNKAKSIVEYMTKRILNKFGYSFKLDKKLESSNDWIDDDIKSIKCVFILYFYAKLFKIKHDIISELKKINNFDLSVFEDYLFLLSRIRNNINGKCKLLNDENPIILNYYNWIYRLKNNKNINYFQKILMLPVYKK